MPRRMRMLAVALAACVMPAVASADYYVNLSFTQVAAGTCGTSGVNIPVSGTIFLDLPELTRNIQVLSVVQALPSAVEWKSVPGPFPQVIPSSGNLSLPTPALVTPPYSLVVTEFPARNDVPLGYGTRLMAECAADGTATLSLDIGVPAPPPASVSTLGPAGLAWLALALALAGAYAARPPRQRWLP